MVDFAECYKANPNYILREIAGEAVLVAIGAEIADFCGIVTLNTSAKVIWKALEQGATKQQLVQKLLETFELTEERAEEDVEKVLQLLQEHGMIDHE